MYNEVEMTSGGQRVHDVNMLRERLKEQGLDPEGFNHYLDHLDMVCHLMQDGD